MRQKNEGMYAEIYAILSTFTDDYISRIPAEMLDFIATNRNKKYLPLIDENKTLREQKVSKKTIAFMAMLKLNYWCETEEEKQEFLNVLESNEVEIKNELMNEKSLLKRLNLLRENENG